MQIYMKSDHGGYMPVYNSSEIAVLADNGWQLVPAGEWPNPPLKKPIEPTKEPTKNKTSPAQLAATKRYYDKKRAEKLK